MKSLMKRLLLLGLPDDNLSRAVRRYQHALSSRTGNRLALRFPVHVTLRGPFWTEGEPHDLDDCLERLCRHLARLPLHLNGPVFVNPDLCWLQVPPASPCFAALADLHAHAENTVRRLVAVDDVPSAFTGTGYRPHMTLGWGATASLRDAQPPLWSAIDLTGTLEKIGIGVYPQCWPAGGNVEIIETIPSTRLQLSHSSIPVRD